MSNRDVFVAPSRIDNKGVFVTRDFKKGEIVLSWNPKPLGKTKFDDLTSEQKHDFYEKNGECFLMQPPERFVNHSCEANTRVGDFCDVAIKDIKAGEEVTSDYGDNYRVPFVCRCGSKNCRKNIGK